MNQETTQADVARSEAGTPTLEAGGSAPGKRDRWRLLRSALVLVLVLVISASVFVISDRVEEFGPYGYPGVFVISLLANATIILPAPSLAVVSIMGSLLNPYVVGLCAGAGEALGEMTGYLAGYSGRAVVEDREKYERMAAWMQRHGLAVIFALSVFPNPFFDLAGIAAGALRIRAPRFLLVCWAGKTIKTILFALGGQAVLSSLLRH